nr:tobamovirus multiplication protein 3-like [Tanacetum cinerariifolium]
MFTSRDSYTLWDELHHSLVLQGRMFHVLATFYGFVAIVALVQSIRIQLRVQVYGWTIQKIFHLSIFLVNAARCVIYIYRHDIQHLTPKITQHIVLDLPSLVYFSTYALLVLFWSEIYYQIALWLIIWWKPIHMLVIISKIFLSGVYLLVAVGFLSFGGRFPVESKGRDKKLYETCFDAFNKPSNQDVSENQVLNFIYYFLVEILLSCVVLFTLRKMPPKQVTKQQHVE